MKDNTSLITGIIKDEVDASMLSLQDIESFINNSSEKVIEFGLKFLRSYKVQGLSIGIGISYSIYMIYLKDKDEKELLEYFIKMRIPKPQKFLEELMAIKKEMSI